MDQKPPFHPSTDTSYWIRLKQWAFDTKSDGCSDVPDFYVECCWQHDRGYQTGENIDGVKYPNRKAIDDEFRKCMQDRSIFGRFSPMSWWRWAAVRLFGWMPWRSEAKERS